MNFSANNFYLVKSYQYDKANIFYFKDKHTHRTYKLYDYQKSFVFDMNIPYCINDGFVESRQDFQQAQYIVLYYKSFVNILYYLLIFLTFYEFIIF
jgi:hypothetical protein